MNKNILYLVGGACLGIVVGFFAANAVGRMPHAASVPGAEASRGRNIPAPPLDAAQAGGPLPPGHPSTGDINGPAVAKGGEPVASNAAAQSALDTADRSPRDFDAQMSAAATFYQLGSYDKATLYLERALALKPTDVDALTAMGDTKYDAGDFQGAARAYERALVQQPNNADLHAELGNTYYQRVPPDYGRAIDEYRKALTIDARHEKALQNLSIAALRQGDRASAREAIERLASVNPSNPTLASLRAQAK
jgi:tetratricopeptide (TPR) repeat protein